MDGRDVVALVEHGRLGRKPRAGTASVAVAASEAASERTRDLESVFDDQITPDPETAMWLVFAVDRDRHGAIGTDQQPDV